MAKIMQIFRIIARKNITCKPGYENPMYPVESRKRQKINESTWFTIFISKLKYSLCSHE